MYDSEERHSGCREKGTHTKALEIHGLFSVQHNFRSCHKATP